MEMERWLTLERLQLFNKAKLYPERKTGEGGMNQEKNGILEAKVGKGFSESKGWVVRKGRRCYQLFFQECERKEQREAPEEKALVGQRVLKVGGRHVDIFIG